MDKAEFVRRSKNLFVFDGPIGRVTLLKIFLLVLFTLIVVVFLGLLISNIVPVRILRFLMIPYSVISFLVIMYVVLLSYIKRLCHIIENKRKSIFYVISVYIILLLMQLIPPLKVLGSILAVVIIVGLVTIPGKIK